jgi:hypothetical protein
MVTANKENKEKYNTTRRISVYLMACIGLIVIYYILVRKYIPEDEQSKYMRDNIMDSISSTGFTGICASIGAFLYSVI